MSIRAFENTQPELHARVYVDESAIVIGDVILEEDCSIWPTTVLRGDVNKIRVGKRTNIQDGTVLHVSHANENNPEGDPVIIGTDVTVGHRVVLHGCTIEDECLIGINAVVLDKAYIQKHVLIGANSLVPPGKIVESGYLYLGSPIKKIRALTEHELAYFKQSALHYVALKERTLRSLIL
jgi:carbonic anhydrase/acetyltransferase-like protein (isoleucine patch superfamily)